MSLNTEVADISASYDSDTLVDSASNTETSRPPTPDLYELLAQVRPAESSFERTTRVIFRYIYLIMFFYYIHLSCFQYSATTMYRIVTITLFAAIIAKGECGVPGRLHWYKFLSIVEMLLVLVCLFGTCFGGKWWKSSSGVLEEGLEVDHDAQGL